MSPERVADLRALLLLSVLLTSGCMGAGATPTATQTPNRPYTEVAILPVTGIDSREPDCDPRPCSEFYHIQLYGSENATRVQGPDEPRQACQKSWLFTAQPANRTLFYNGASFRPDRETLKSIVSTNFWGAAVDARGVTEGCPTSYHLDPYPSVFPQEFVRPVGSYGAVRFNVYRDGTIWFPFSETQEYLIELGDKLVVSYARQRITDDATYYVRGGFEIVNLGPWPMDGLQPQSSGTVTRGPG